MLCVQHADYNDLHVGIDYDDAKSRLLFSLQHVNVIFDQQ